MNKEQKNKIMTYHDLDQFAATWTSEEAKIFMDQIADFEKVDKDPLIVGTTAKEIL